MNFICPICKKVVEPSDYLHGIFSDDEYAEYAANLITHYRHEHINYYDKAWKFPEYAEKIPEYTNHDQFKDTVNNRAKRVLIRAIEKNFKKEDALPLIRGFLKLKNNDEKTLELIKKFVIIDERQTTF